MAFDDGFALALEALHDHIEVTHDPWATLGCKHKVTRRRREIKIIIIISHTIDRKESDDGECLLGDGVVGVLAQTQRTADQRRVTGRAEELIYKRSTKS